MAKGDKRKRGRPRKDGPRYANGHLTGKPEKFTPPPDHVEARRERFRHFRGDGSIGLEMTCAGRLMLVGAFDGLPVPAESLLDELQKYTLAYWGNYMGLGPTIGSYEPRSRSSCSGAWADPGGEWFRMKDSALSDAGRAARQAVIDVTVDRHWFPDEDKDWAARIINTRIVQKREQFARAGRPIPDGLGVVGELACDSDWAMLRLLRHGAMALAGSESGRRAA